MGRERGDENLTRAENRTRPEEEQLLEPHTGQDRVIRAYCFIPEGPRGEALTGSLEEGRGRPL